MSSSNPHETCVACGAEPPARFSSTTGAALPAVHPWVAVVQADAVPAGREALHDGQNDRGRAFASVPVCDRCHREPSRHAGLKAHFFPRAMAKVATLMAGTDSGIVSV